MARHWKARAGTLVAAGTYGLHQLRYAIGYGGDSGRELAAQGHAYLAFVAPLIAVALLLCAVELAVRAARARTADVPAAAPSLRTLWALAATALISSYGAQEALEGALSGGHPGGIDAFFGGGGWVALPLALLIGLAVALLLRGAAQAIQLAAEPRPRIGWPRPLISIGSAAAVIRPATPVLAAHAGARGPPLASV